MDKRFLFFLKKEDARKRFPNAKLVMAFAGTEGWVWTTKTYAQKHKLSWHEE